MNTLKHSNRSLSSITAQRSSCRVTFGIFALLVLTACDAERQDFDDHDIDLRGGSCSLPTIPENDAYGPDSTAWCQTLKVEVKGCGDAFSSGKYRWSDCHGYTLTKQDGPFTYHNRIRPAFSEPDHWALVYEGFSRDNEYQPYTAYTEVATAEVSGELPQNATWRGKLGNSVTVTCADE